MKLNKLLALLFIAPALMLGACNNNSGNPVDPDDEWEEEEEEEEAEPALSYSSIDVVKSGNDVSLKLVGSTDEIEGISGSMKAAFGLESLDSEDEEPFIVGKEEPAATDYNINVTVGADGEFTAQIKLTGMTGIKAGKYRMHFGPKDYYGQVSGTVGTNPKNDADYRYYFRNDNDVGNRAALVIDDMAPVRIQKVSVELNVPGKTGIFGKIGGLNKNNLTEAQLNAYSSYVNFQKLPNTNQRVYKEGSDEVQPGNPYYFWKVEGNEAFIYINIDYMVAEGATSGKYNTHLNVVESKQQNCVSEGLIEGTPVVVNEAGDTIQAYSNPEGGHTEDNIWGNVGFVVTIAERASEGGDGSQEAA